MFQAAVTQVTMPTSARAACRAPGRLSRPASPLLNGATRVRNATRRRSGMAVQAALLPAVVPELGRMVTAFTLVFCGLNWVQYRNIRVKSEKAEDERTGTDDERKARIQKLTRGKGEGADDISPNNKD